MGDESVNLGGGDLNPPAGGGRSAWDEAAGDTIDLEAMAADGDDDDADDLDLEAMTAALDDEGAD